LNLSAKNSLSITAQIILISLGASVLLFLVYSSPNSSKLSHLDFNPRGKNSVEFCDPNNPRIIAVENKIPRVSLQNLSAKLLPTVFTTSATFDLLSASGKLIGPKELSEATNQNFQIILASPSLDDVQIVEPNPTHSNGTWTFNFSPKFQGEYVLFADITPEVTQAEIYTSARFNVLKGQSFVNKLPQIEDAVRANLINPTPILYSGQAYEFTLKLITKGNETISVIPSFGSFAHLIVIDSKRASFINLKTDPKHIAHNLDTHAPEFFFDLTLPDPGLYYVWAEINLSGTIKYYPFKLKIEP
jgi:hypothetical protein